jgi:hypothetical protein
LLRHRLLYSRARNGDSRFRPWLAPNISFVLWQESARVQAADLLAFEAWKALDHTVGPVTRTRKSRELLRATQRFETYSYSEDWFRDLKSHLDSGEPEKIVGFDESDYAVLALRAPPSRLQTGEGTEQVRRILT